MPLCCARDRPLQALYPPPAQACRTWLLAGRLLRTAVLPRLDRACGSWGGAVPAVPAVPAAREATSTPRALSEAHPYYTLWAAFLGRALAAAVRACPLATAASPDAPLRAILVEVLLLCGQPWVPRLAAASGSAPGARPALAPRGLLLGLLVRVGLVAGGEGDVVEWRESAKLRARRLRLAHGCLKLLARSAAARSLLLRIGGPRRCNTLATGASTSRLSGGAG